jgi:carboxyl-terminal processing protease
MKKIHITKKKTRVLIYAGISIILIACVFLVGAYVGYAHRPEVDKVLSVINKEPEVQTDADFEAFWKVWNTLNEKSIYASKVSDQDRVWGAAQGLAASLGDPYTVFFPPEDNQLFNDEIKGSFGGIGAEIGIKDNILTIVSPLKDTPADKAGLKAGDKILKIDGKDATNMNTDQAISLIRGPQGTTVDLTILRGSEQQTRDFKIVRDTINTPITDSELRPDGIFVIHLYSFSENSSELFNNELKKFIASGSHKLILDMRGNPGGYLQSAVNIGSWFIDQGQTIVTEDFGGNKTPNVYRSTGPRLFDDKLQFVVLVDGGSASAAEILAGALQEHNIATLVGEQTFGKGSVQELVPITDDTSLKVTVARWLTPNGTSISEHGLTPDVVVPMTQKQYDAGQDPQMDKAVQILEAKP